MTNNNTSDGLSLALGPGRSLLPAVDECHVARQIEAPKADQGKVGEGLAPGQSHWGLDLDVSLKRFRPPRMSPSCWSWTGLQNCPGRRAFPACSRRCRGTLGGPCNQLSWLVESRRGLQNKHRLTASHLLACFACPPQGLVPRRVSVSAWEHLILMRERHLGTWGLNKVDLGRQLCLFPRAATVLLSVSVSTGLHRSRVVE